MLGASSKTIKQKPVWLYIKENLEPQHTKMMAKWDICTIFALMSPQVWVSGTWKTYG